MGMAKLSGKNRRALLSEMKNLKEEGLICAPGGNKRVLDRKAASDQRKFADRGTSRRWLYKPTDLVRCKHWQLGEFIATVIEVQDEYAHLLGPMGSVHVPCQMLRLIDRFEDPCEEPST